MRPRLPWPKIVLWGGLFASLPAAEACGGATSAMELRWTINGSTSEDPDRSLDSCAEVAAAQVLLRAIAGGMGLPPAVPCARKLEGGIVPGGFDQLVHFPTIEQGSWTIGLTLANEEGQPWTAEQVVALEVSEFEGLGRVDFPAVVFHEPGSSKPLLLPGTHRFRTLYHDSADSLATVAVMSLRLRTPDGAVLSITYCVGASCQTGAGPLEVANIGSDAVHKVEGIDWGRYQLEISAKRIDQKVCWSGSYEIVVGAGNNPVTIYDLESTCN
jgi:hypothetical protein